MIGRRTGLKRLGAAASAWLACTAITTAASAALRDPADAPSPHPLPDDARATCPLCSQNGECPQHLT